MESRHLVPDRSHSSVPELDTKTQTPNHNGLSRDRGSPKDLLCSKCRDKLCPILSSLARQRAHAITFRKEARGQSKVLGHDGDPDEGLIQPEREIEAVRKGLFVRAWLQEGCPLARFLIEKVIGSSTDISTAKLTIAVRDSNYNTSPLREDLHIADFSVRMVWKRPKRTTTRTLSTEIFTSHESTISQSILGRPLYHSLGSREAIQLARTWITRCMEGKHRQCPPTKESQLPSRVIHILPDGTDTDARVSLQVVSRGERGHYIALTYCWGEDQTYFLTTENLGEMQSSIRLTYLPRTICDAIRVTRQLGFEYLWVDALCILQDSKTDMAEQISRMQDIYRNAILTISAERAADCRDGFLGTSHFAADGVPPKVVSEEMQYRSLNGCVGPIWLRELKDQPGEVQPIHKRGWTYQEHFLSRRILAFGSQLGWRCSSGEDVNSGLAAVYTGASADPYTNPLYLATLAQESLEERLWHRALLPLRLLTWFSPPNPDFPQKNILDYLGRLFESSSDESSSDECSSGEDVHSAADSDMHGSSGDDVPHAAKTRAYSSILGLERLTSTRNALWEWAEDHRTNRAIRLAIQKNDIQRLIQAFSPGLVSIFKAVLNEPILSILDPELRSRLRHSITEADGVEALNVVVEILGRILQGVYGNPERLDWLIEDSTRRNHTWAALEAGSAKMLIEAWIPDMIPKWVELLESNSGVDDVRNKQALTGLQSEEPATLQTFSKLVSLYAKESGRILNLKIAHRQWMKVVEEYSRRTLSKASDRLPALSGIAAEFSRYTEGRYLAGLWENKVFEGLLWRQENRYITTEAVPFESQEHLGTVLPTTSFYVAPSWTWASSTKPVVYAESGSLPLVAEFCCCNFSLKAEENIFGEVQEGTLVLRCPLSRVDRTWFYGTWFGEKEVFPDSGSELGLALESGMNPFDYEKQYFWLARIFHKDSWTSSISQGLILTEVKPDRFKRVGFYKRSFVGATYFSGITFLEHAQDVFEIKEISII